ncbi:hypothetical protein ACLB2K_018406 [Fragaria x ananassa]
MATATTLYKIPRRAFLVFPHSRLRSYLPNRPSFSFKLTAGNETLRRDALNRCVITASVCLESAQTPLTNTCISQSLGYTGIEEDNRLIMEGGVASDAGSAVAPIAKWRDEFAKTFQYYLDRSTPNPVHRWLGTLAVTAIYVLRVYLVQGFYIVSYGLGIYILNLLIGFLSPKVDPELEGLDGAALPTRGLDEFKPFIRRLPEFKFWYSITKAFCIAFLMTFFSVFDVPVFWPILLCYWIVLFVLTMKRQIMHMIKYKYVPFSIGKQRYVGKPAASSSGSAD